MVICNMNRSEKKKFIVKKSFENSKNEKLYLFKTYQGKFDIGTVIVLQAVFF